MTKKINIFILLALFFALPQNTHAVDFVRGETPAIPVTLTYKDQMFVLDQNIITRWQPGTTIIPPQLKTKALDSTYLFNSFIGNKHETENEPIKNQTTINDIYTFTETIANSINTPKQEPKITISNNKVTEFIEPKTGILVDTYKTTHDILEALTHGKTNLEITVHTIKPEQKISDLNNLGINEILAIGESSFKGSPNNRRHNIKVGTEKMTGLLIAPGETFSFNKFLGPVEADQGFLPELVIKKTGTVPELGGGLCQVSSTVFRAAMKAGLPIVERRNHAYAVQYYAPQGTDATIYPGIVDFKFTNDTQAHILIWPIFTDTNTLTFEFWGTKDNREVVLHTPVQYDRKEDGSMKATWQREVTFNGHTTQDILKSVYQPPALFHKQEQFVTAATSTTPTN